MGLVNKSFPLSVGGGRAEMGGGSFGQKSIGDPLP